MSDIPRHVFDGFLSRLTAVLGEPSSPDPQGFIREYARMLRNYSSDELSRAADHLLATHKGPQRWPRIADCIEAAESAREANQNRARSDQRTDHGDWSARAAEAERAMRNSEMGQAAAAEGWCNGLREFLMANRRWPASHEIHEMKRNAVFIDRCAAGTVDMGIMHKSLQSLAERVVERRFAIADRITGERD